MNKRQLERKKSIENLRGVLKENPINTKEDEKKLVAKIMLNYVVSKRTALEYLETARAE